MADRASRPWKRATVVALVLHAALITLAVRSVRIVRPPPQARPVDVQLIWLRPPPLRREPPPASKAASSPAPVAAARAAPAGPAPLLVAPAATAAVPAQGPSSDGAADRVRAMLRGSAGCDSAGFLKLSETERQTCARWRTAHVDPNLELQAPIDPVKRSWYEATMQYRKNGRYMPIGPPGRGVAVTPGLPPGHVLAHIGPLSIGLPPGAFNDDDAPPP